MNIGEIYEAEIEKLTNLGYGLAHVDGFVVFVEGGCPSDKLKIKITKKNKSFAYAKIEEIVEPSWHRVKAFCPMQKVCGACQIQYIDYEYQLELKREIVRETIAKIGGLDIDIPLPVASPQIKNFRHKIQYPVTQTKNSKRIIAGYYKPTSHELVNIKYCPIQPQICDEIIEYIKEYASEFGISGYVEKNHSGDLKHIVIRVSAYNDEILLTLVMNAKENCEKFISFCKKIYENFEKICGICINFNPKNTNVIMGEKTQCVIGKNYIEEKILDKIFIVGAQTFFQVNPKSAENIFGYVKEYIKNNFSNPLVLDAYAGISAFGISICDTAQKVVTIEENACSVELARKSLELNNIQNVEIHSGDAGEFFSNEKRKFNVIILDPPRKGCSEQSLNEALRLCNDTIIYVSCNPSTLARDLKFLVQKGCKVESIQPFDMFCHTYHIENVAIIKV